MEKDKTICRCCLLEDNNIDSNDYLLNMENEAFIHQNQRVFFVDAFADLNNKPDDDRSAIYMSDVRICGSCAVLLESAYILRKMCENADRLTQNYCRCCQLENNDKNVHFLTLNTEVFEHNQKSISFTEGFSAVNNYSVEDSDSFRTTNSSLCENCAVLLESAYVFQKMCRAATAILHPKNSTSTNPPDNAPIEEKNSPRTVIEKRLLRSSSKAINVEKPQSRKRKIDEPFMKLQTDGESRTQEVRILYQCKKCAKKHKSKIGLETHRRIMHKDVHSIRDLYFRVSKRRPVLRSVQEQQSRRYCCQYCDKSYPTENYLSIHRQSQHKKTPQTKTKYLRNLYECKPCGKTFIRGKNLIYHNESVHLKLRYRCEKCPKVYHTKSSFHNHYQSEHMNNPFACKDCSNIYKSAERLSYHKRSVHLKTMLNCKQCNNAFGSPATLRQHIQREHQIIHACQDCDMVYKQAIGLAVHKLEVHMKRQSKCKYCLKKFNTRRALLRHIKYIHVTVDYKCEECPKIFRQRDSLTSHIRRIHQDTKYACKDCDKKFIVEKSLELHRATVHLKKPLECIKCPKKFKNQYQLKIHIDAEHLGKKFSCKICKQIYVSAGVLRAHIKNLHEKVPYPCDQCPKVYKALCGLIGHKKTKHQNKRWSCEHCAKIFETKSGQHSHIKRKRCPVMYKNAVIISNSELQL